MFSASFPNGGALLKKIIEIVKDNIPEGVLTVSEEGLYFQSMDSSHVALVDLRINRIAATSFVCEGTHQLGINFDALSKIFKCATSVGTCILQYDGEEGNDVLNITFHGGKRAAFEMKLMDIETEMLSIPPNEQECQQMIESSELQKILKDLSVFSENVEISCSKNKLSFTSKGDTTNATVDLEVESSYEGTYKGEYSLKYLSWFAKASSLCDQTLLALDSNLPLLMQFEDSHLRLQFYLAPKVGDDDE